MFQRVSKAQRAWSTFIVVALGLAACLLWQGRWINHTPRPDDNRRESATVVNNSSGPSDSVMQKQQLSGAPAQRYLEQASDGQSLMQAVTEERFGLKLEQRDPISGAGGAGYLGMSHDQNLNAWFDETGATIRSTGSEKAGTEKWQIGFRLQAYGYGSQLRAAPPIVGHQVKGTRIEYERSDFGFRNANFEFNKGSLFNSQFEIRNPQFVEWYENRSEGIEQGFTLNERPARAVDVSPSEPLRLVVSVIGDLRARAEVDGNAVELYRGGQGILSYSHLVATDNAGKKLTARMETNEAGDEIALVVDDAGAEYPIVVDPVTATQKQKLDAGVNRQADARFGFAVAISGGNAIVGAWREDLPGAADAGGVYVFLRSAGSGNWTLLNRYNPDASPGAACGSSVDISATPSEPSNPQMMYGCPGASNGIGRAFSRGPYANRHRGGEEELIPFSSAPGDAPRHGTSVAISTNLFVGAPAFDSPGLTNNGIVAAYNIFDASNKTQVTDPNPGTNDQFGTSIAANFLDDTSSLVLVVGAPGVFSNTGTAAVFTPGNSTGQPSFLQYLQPVNADLGANFGNSVALSSDTVVVGAPFDDNERGTAAGAAYVFVRGSNGFLSQQQKLTASNGRANDHFSEHAVAVEGHLIVVGANGHDRTVGSGFDAGAAYLFSRQGTVWTEETTFAPNEGFGETDGDQFGIGVGLSADTLIVGARAASALDNSNVTGAAYTYGIDCIPAYHSRATITSLSDTKTAQTVCPGAPLFFPGTFSGGTAATIQWRRNGVNIPGATSTSLSITATVATEGAYDFVVSNACGSETSNVATLTVLRFTLSPTGQNIAAAGSDGLFKVTAGATCGYTAISNDSWIHITSNATGNSPQDVAFHVDANTGPNQRVGSITVGDKNFSISQDGLNCSYSISPSSQNFTSAGGTNSVGVTATPGCAWNAASNDSWISVPAGSGGTGNGTLSYTVAANTGPQRTGMLTVAGQNFTVTQASGCAFAINPASQNFTAAGGSNVATVTAGGGCAWTATSNSSFVTITSGSGGSGNGAVNYSVSANGGTTQRTGTMTIADQTFIVTQDAATPTPTPTPVANVVQFSSSNYSVVEDCTTVTITVNRVGDTSGAASVDYSTSDVSASERRDYITALGQLNFAPGETSKSFAVLINEDSYVEGPETFNVSLSNASGVGLGGPSIATVTIVDDATEPASNAIDDPQTFVCQHYHDFLNRAPDAGGLAFWTNEITSCGANQACIELKRVNVSAAYFLSIEFQQTGYLVERLYKSAYGNASGNSTFGGNHQLAVPIARLNEFLPDTQSIGKGVVVGQAGWEQVLENNKQAFIASFVQRSRFTTAFPVSLTPAQFVDSLNANAGNSLSPSERDQLVNGLTGGTLNRAQVLRAVAEDSDLVSGESNRAFVLMQFFGYLRRNPNDPQDTDYTGYDFWLTKLNQFNGDYQNAEMVKAFITSGEYRQRFGP